MHYSLALLIGCLVVILGCKVEKISSTEFCPTTPNDKQKIPKIVHHIWHDWTNGLDPQPPPYYQKWSKEFEELHPASEGWTFYYWENDSSLRFMKTYYPHYTDMYLSYDKPIKRADALRYFLLDHFGGVYLDMGFVPIKKIDPLIENCGVVLFEQSDRFSDLRGRINNAAMASAPGHPLWKTIIEALPERVESHVLFATGPQLITEKSLDFLRQAPGSIKIYDKRLVYPFDWRQKDGDDARLCLASSHACKQRFPDSYLVKHWGGSWLENES